MWVALAAGSSIVAQQPTATKEKAMLVLSRREGESIVLDGEITVTVLELHGNFVRLGVDAPDNVKILRDELVGKERIDEAV